MFGVKMKKGLASSIIPKNVLPKLQTEEDLEMELTTANANSVDVSEIGDEIEVGCKGPVEVELSGETEDVELEDVDNIIPARIQKIKQHREESHTELQKQARKMKATSSKQMPTVRIGQTVKIKIPEVDRSKVDARILLAVVLQIVDGDFYRLVTKREHYLNFSHGTSSLYAKKFF